MNQWDFVMAAYAVALLPTAGLLLWAFATMRRAERVSDEMRGGGK